MIKICSLEFLNRNVFETDIFLEDGRTVFAKGTKITPEILLRLYFKEIYVEKWPLEEEKVTKIEPIPEEKFDFETMPGENPIEEAIKEVLDTPLEFDEAEAKRISAYAVTIAKAIGLEESKINEVEKAAYYHKIGIIKFTNDDLKNPNFKKDLCKASYDTVLHEMSFPEKIAEAAKFYRNKYETTYFDLDKNSIANIPYSHIVAIASYYDGLLAKNISKEDALKKMLQVGGNRFNIFILHKFINTMKKMKDENEQ